MNLPPRPMTSSAPRRKTLHARRFWRHAPLRRGAFLLAALAALWGAPAWSQGAAPATAGKAIADRASERGRVANIVRDLLLNDPTLLRDALEALQKREHAQREQARAQVIQGLAGELAREADLPVSGPADADATLIEFFDYQCGYCKRALPELQALKRRDARLRIVYKDLPVLGPESQALARASLAAHRQGRFEPFHEALMAMERPDRAAARVLAERLGLDMARFDRDLEDPALEAALARNRRQAEALEIEGTPAFVVGNQLIPGAVDAETLAAMLQALRLRKGTAGGR